MNISVISEVTKVLPLWLWCSSVYIHDWRKCLISFRRYWKMWMFFPSEFMDLLDSEHRPFRVHTEYKSKSLPYVESSVFWFTEQPNHNYVVCILVFCLPCLQFFCEELDCLLLVLLLPWVLFAEDLLHLWC